MTENGKWKEEVALIVLMKKEAFGSKGRTVQGEKKEVGRERSQQLGSCVREQETGSAEQGRSSRTYAASRVLRSRERLPVGLVPVPERVCSSVIVCSLPSSPLPVLGQGPRHGVRESQSAESVFGTDTETDRGCTNP